jgi:hypothetical protein
MSGYYYKNYPVTSITTTTGGTNNPDFNGFTTLSTTYNSLKPLNLGYIMQDGTDISNTCTALYTKYNSSNNSASIPEGAKSIRYMGCAGGGAGGGGGGGAGAIQETGTLSANGGAGGKGGAGGFSASESPIDISGYDSWSLTIPATQGGGGGGDFVQIKSGGTAKGGNGLNGVNGRPNLLNFTNSTNGSSYPTIRIGNEGVGGTGGKGGSVKYNTALFSTSNESDGGAGSSGASATSTSISNFASDQTPPGKSTGGAGGKATKGNGNQGSKGAYGSGGAYVQIIWLWD